MVNEREYFAPRVKVSFSRSSTKDGGTGSHVEVSEGCEALEARRIYDLAVLLKRMADAELRGPSLEEQLEKSVEREKARL